MDQKNLADLYGLDPVPWSRALEALESDERKRTTRGSLRPLDPTAARTSQVSGPCGTTARSTS